MSNAKKEMLEGLRRTGAINIERVDKIGENKELYRYISAEGVPMSAIFLCCNNDVFICIGANVREKEKSLVEHFENF